MGNKVEVDPEFKLDSINKLVAEYEERKYLVIPVYKLRAIFDKK